MTARNPTRSTAPTPGDRLDSFRADPEIRRWYDGHRSASTARVQLYQLELFSRRVGKSPSEIAALGRRQAKRKDHEFEDLVLGWVAAERAAGRPDSYLSVVYAAVRSWLKHEESLPSWSPKLRVRFGATILNEIVPTPEQLRAVLDRTPVPRLRALLLILATSGIRPGVLACDERPAGLRLKNLPALSVSPKPHFEGTAPFKVEVPAELSKAGNAYWSYITDEAAVEYVRYLEIRVERGESLTPDSAVFSPEPKAPAVQSRRAPDGVAFLSEGAVSNQLRLVLRKVQPDGVRWRPYVLRAFASSQFMLGENARLMNRNTRDLLLGHKATIDQRYNSAKGRLRDDIEAGIREQYAAVADQYLRILTISERGVDYRPILRVLLSGAGYSKAQIDAMGELTEETTIEAIRAKRSEGVEVPRPKPGDNARTVAVSELDRYLALGWKPIAPAGSERFVVGAPN